MVVNGISMPIICILMVSLSACLCVCLYVQSGGVWGWITNLRQARRHLLSRWGSAQTSQVTHGNLKSPFSAHKKCSEQVTVCLSSAASGSAHFLFAMLCLVLSRWRRTCALSSSRRMTSKRTLKGNGSSTLDTERTTSSPSFTEPSWSDIRFFILLFLLLLFLPQPFRLHIYKLRLGL